MNRTIALILFALFATPLTAPAAAVPGAKAPDFKVKGAAGKPHSLSDYKGKWLVLEWFNKNCPYVRKHYGAGNMQMLQKKYSEKGVVWLTVISSAEGKQGHQSPKEALAVAKEKNSAAAAILLDESGDMGRAYGAKTTPHMFVISPKGSVVYAGAIDDNDSANPDVIPESRNYVAAALDSAMTGKPVETASSRPYGCSVKY